MLCDALVIVQGHGKYIYKGMLSDAVNQVRLVHSLLSYNFDPFVAEMCMIFFLMSNQEYKCIPSNQ